MIENVTDGERNTGIFFGIPKHRWEDNIKIDSCGSGEGDVRGSWECSNEFHKRQEIS
jgi:hypothetical protein